MKTAKRILSYVLTAMMMLSVFTVNAGAISLGSSGIEASDSSISAEQIISPDAVYVSDNLRVNFSAAMLGGSKIHFLLDGKKFHEFDVVDDTSMQTYSVNAKLIDEIWGYRTFTAEKYDNTGKLLSSVSKSVKITTSKYEFMELYPVNANGSPLAGYDIRNSDNGLKYGYPRAEKATSEYAGTQNPYIFETKTLSGCGEIVYYDDDGDGTKDSIRATTIKAPSTSDWSCLNTPYQDYIKLLQSNKNLTELGGIIEIKFDIKMHNTTNSRFCILGLPTWVNSANIGHYQVITKGKHLMFEGGTGAKEFTNGIDLTQWNEFKLQYDTDNKKWTFIVNEGKANEYRNTANLSTTKPDSTSTEGSYAIGSKGIMLGLYTYRDDPNNGVGGGFTIKDMHVTRYNDAPQIDEILVDGTPITNEKISIEAQTISGTLTAPYDDITENDVCFKVNGTEITGGEFTLGSDNVSFSYTIPNGTIIKDKDKVTFYIKGSAKIDGLPSGINQGFVLKGADPLMEALDTTIDADGDACLNITIDRTKLTKDTPLAIFCVYDTDGNLISMDSAFVSGDNVTLEIPYSRIGTDIENCKSTFFITEGNLQAADDDYMNIRCYEDIKNWNR